MNVTAGTLDLSGGGTDVGALYEGTGTIEFGGGTRTLDAASNITGNALFAGNATTVTTVNGGVGTGLMSVTGGTATFNSTVSTGGLTQSGGELNGTGALTVTGASNFSGGTQSGSGTTIAQGGAAFTLTSFGLDGGRTLQLGGTSTASGTNVQINLNGYNPSTGVSNPGSGTLTIESGATLNDQTTSSGLQIIAISYGGSDTGATAAVNNQGTFEKTGSAATSTISTLFNNTGTVNVTAGTLDLNGSVNNAGLLEADGGNIIVSVAESGGGSAEIFGTSQIQYGAASNENITFSSGATGEILLLDSVAFTGQISDFTGTGTGTPATSDKLDLRDVNFSLLTIKTYTENGAGTGGTLTLSDGTHTANINMVGTYTLANFHFATDGSGGTLVTDPPVVSEQSANNIAILPDASSNHSTTSSEPVPTSTNQNAAGGGAQIGETNAGNPIVPSTTWQQGDETFKFKTDFGSHARVNATSSDTHNSPGFSSVTDVHQLQTYLNDVLTGPSLFNAANGGHDNAINHGHHDSISLAHVQMPDLHTGNFIIHA